MRAPLPRLARLALALGLFTSAGRAQDALTSEIERRAAALAGTVAGWRHDIHQHPELSNQETRTAALVAAHLRKLGLEVHQVIEAVNEFTHARLATNQVKSQSFLAGSCVSHTASITSKSK